MTAAGAGLSLLFGGADQHLVDGDVPRAGDDVGDRVGDVPGLHRLPEPAPYALEHLGLAVGGVVDVERVDADECGIMISEPGRTRPAALA